MRVGKLNQATISIPEMFTHFSQKAFNLFFFYAHWINSEIGVTETICGRQRIPREGEEIL